MEGVKAICEAMSAVQRANHGLGIWISLMKCHWIGINYIGKTIGITGRYYQIHTFVSIHTGWSDGSFSFWCIGTDSIWLQVKPILLARFNWASYLIVLLPGTWTPMVRNFTCEKCILTGIDFCVLWLFGKSLECVRFCKWKKKVEKNLIRNVL